MSLIDLRQLLTRLRTEGEVLEIDTGLEPTTEFIRAPLADTDIVSASTGTDIVLTRLRTEPTDRWRDDPEPALAREFDLPATIDVDADVTLRLDRRADPQLLADVLAETATATAHL